MFTKPNTDKAVIDTDRNMLPSLPERLGLCADHDQAHQQQFTSIRGRRAIRRNRSGAAKKMSAKCNIDNEDDNHINDTIINYNCRKTSSKLYYSMIRRNLSTYHHYYYYAAAALLMVSLVITTTTTTTTAQPFASDSGTGANGQPRGTGGAFDPSTFKSVYDLIQSHPDLRQFASLCELKGVKEIVSVNAIPLTVFAPIDKSLAELVAKATGGRGPVPSGGQSSSSRGQINLVDLAKQHIVQGLVVPDESIKYPFQFVPYAQMSPLYLNQVRPQRAANYAQHFVNNAKILSTHLIAIDDNQYQTLHVIDQPIEYAFATRHTHLRSTPLMASSLGSPHSSANQAASSGSPLQSSRQSLQQPHQQRLHQQFATVKRPLTFDDLASDTSGSFVQDFYQRFADVSANQPFTCDLYKARSLMAAANSGSEQQRIDLKADQVSLEGPLAKIRQRQALADAFRGKLHQLNESNSLNTYFLPVPSDELDKLLDGADLEQYKRMVLEAHVIPGQVLFTRPMSLGQPHATMLIEDSSSSQVELSLAKALPVVQPTDTADVTSRKMLTTPLLVQARTKNNRQQVSSEGQLLLRNGLTSAEIVVANIPLSNGVLHLIKRPLVDVNQTNLLDYLNDNDNQLSPLVRALGSRTEEANDEQPELTGQESDSSLVLAAAAPDRRPTVQVNKFRELLVRERALWSTFAASDINRTLLVPTDEAFAKLRYDLRALIFGDSSLIPAHWDETYKRNLLMQLLKRHMISGETITSDQLSGGDDAQSDKTSDNGKTIRFAQAAHHSMQVKCEGDASAATVLHRDLIGSNGVMHIIDRVLGEEQESMYTLLESMLLRNRIQLAEPPLPESGKSSSSPDEPQPVPFYSAQSELADLIEASLRQLATSGQQPSALDTNALDAGAVGGDSVTRAQDSGEGATLDAGNKGRQARRRNSAEMDAISKTVDQYLAEMSATNPSKYQQIATSVNISYQLAKLTSAQQVHDWSDQFKELNRMFTYFVPSDLAWIKAQQQQPELYKPLMHFLGGQVRSSSDAQQSASSQQSTAESVVAGSGGDEPTTSVAPLGAGTGQRLRLRALTESSYRLRQILERHLVQDRKLSASELNELNSLRTIGAKLQLVEPLIVQQPAAQLNSNDQQQQSVQSSGNQLANAFTAALHSILPSTTGAQPVDQPSKFYGTPATQNLKILKYADSVNANILQINEATNGFVYILDNVFLLPEDTNHIVQTSSSPTMSSLLGAHNSAILDFIQNLFLLPGNGTAAQYSILALIGTLSLAIVLMLVFALVLVVARKRRQNKLNRHHQLESGLTSSSTASNSGSTSTTKSL